MPALERPMDAPLQKPRRSIVRAIALRLAVIVPLFLTLRFTGLVESFAFYMPSREPFTTPAGIEDVAFTTSDGKQLHAWFVRASGAAPGEKRPAILHVHGNAGNVSHHLAFSQHLADPGFHVLLFDYRGFGRSDKARLLTRSALMQDTRAAWAALRARTDVDADRCGVYGVSLGGAFALALAREQPEQVRAICTVSAFTSFSDIASDKVPLLGRLLVPSGLEGHESAARVQCPLLIMHGEADSIIPVSHAGALEHAATKASMVRRIIISAADHNDIMDGSIAQQETIDFFELLRNEALGSPAAASPGST